MKWTRLLFYINTGALLGAILSSWLGPKGIAWYFDPPVNIGINCKSATEWSMSNLIRLQLIGIFAGAVLSLIFKSIFDSKRKNKLIDNDND
jgi:hypothetical protein